MNIIGIVCEYNPFHKGHQEHIRLSRAALGEGSPVVCVMSGDFVQRGTPAVFDKHRRAQAACAGGADLVLELPLPWSLSSAEGFARGAVGLLGALGVVTHLSFGSECGDLAPLTALALAASEPETLEAVKAEMSAGMSFAPARQKVLQSRLGDVAELLERPNNILGVEYLKALFSLGLDITPLTSRRTESVHDKPGDGEIRSAAEIRSRMEAGEDVSGFIPPEALQAFRGSEAVTMADLEQAYMARLRMLSEDDFAALPDATEGLGNRLYKAIGGQGTVEGILSAVKTKRYPLSRLRRMLSGAVLGLRAEDAQGLPPYARVLAATERGRALLRQIDGAASVPVITKPTSVKTLGGEALRLFELGARARDFYVLGYETASRRAAATDWRTNPAMLP